MFADATPNLLRAVFRPQLFVLFVALPEPGDDREALATRDGDDFMKRVGRERN